MFVIPTQLCDVLVSVWSGGNLCHRALCFVLFIHMYRVTNSVITENRSTGCWSRFAENLWKKRPRKKTFANRNFQERGGEIGFFFGQLFSIMSTSLLVVFGLTILCKNEAFSCRQPCRTVEPVRGFRLDEQSYRTYKSVTLERCILLCEENTGCISINYFKSTRKCQLNKSSKDDAIDDFVQDSNCLYIDNVLHQDVKQGPLCKCKLGLDLTTLEASG